MFRVRLSRAVCGRAGHPCKTRMNNTLGSGNCGSWSRAGQRCILAQNLWRTAARAGQDNHRIDGTRQG